jgi:hypothetical protein
MLTRNSRLKALQDEIFRTHSLLFYRDSASLKLASDFYGLPFRSEASADFWATAPDRMYKPGVRYYREDVVKVENMPAEKILQRFPYYAPRMVHLLERMENWKPHTFREVFIPAYVDRTNWYVSIFAIVFGIMSVLGLALNAYQIYLGQRQLAVALQALNPT